MVAVTGGAQGIGKCCAECFAREGATVHVAEADWIGMASGYDHDKIAEVGWTTTSAETSPRPTTRWDELMTVRRFVYHKEPNLKDIEFSILKHQGDDEKTGAADDRHPTAPRRRKSRSWK